MTQKLSLKMTQDLFKLMKQFPRVKLKRTDEVTQSEQELLVALALNISEDEKALPVTRISNLLQITPAGVTHLLNPLEETGHIERLPDPTDRRIVRIGLTAKGARVAEISMESIQEKMEELVNFLGEEDSKAFARLMALVIDHFTESFLS